jgi:hypothetical protein
MSPILFIHSAQFSSKDKEVSFVKICEPLLAWVEKRPGKTPGENDYYLSFSCNYPKLGERVLYQDWAMNNMEEVEESIISGIKIIHQKTSEFLNNIKEQKNEPIR